MVASGKVNVNGFNFKCLVQHRPKVKPMSNPRGLAACDSKTLARWREDQFAQAPYLYRPENLLRPTSPREGATSRRMIAVEMERLHMYDTNHTAAVAQLHEDPRVIESKRISLLGTSWHLGVTLFLLDTLGIAEAMPQRVEPTSGWVPHAMPDWQSDILHDVDPETIRAYGELLTSHKESLTVAWKSCPYTSYRLEEGLPCDILLGPDHAELNASSIMGLAAGLQRKKAGMASSGVRIIPPFVPMFLCS